MVHVRRATIGDLKLENTHPFSRRALHLLPQRHDPEGRARSCRWPTAQPRGDTDSERFFNLLMTGFDPDDVIGSLRRTVEAVCERCRFSALNFLFCDGRRLYAYRLGVYRLFWLVRNLDLDADTQTHYHLHLERPHGEHVVLVSSEKLDDDEPWDRVRAGRAAGLRPGRPRPSAHRAPARRARGRDRVRAARRAAQLERRRARQSGRRERAAAGL